MPDVRPDIREVYEMVTKQKPSDAGALERQRTRQIRTMRNRKAGAFAVAAAIGVVAVAVILGTRAERNKISLGNQPQATAKEVATGFLEAHGAFDVDRAITYVADDADLAVLTGSAEGGDGTLDDLRLNIAWLEAVGYEQMLDSCEETSSTSFGTIVHCAFDFHFLRSDEIGRGPFSGSYIDLTVRDEEIVRASLHWDITKFSPQMWEPFADWVSTTYPEDAAVRYQDATYSLERLTEESIRLWERHSREYVEVVGRSAEG